jgi:hypothetical protein
MYSIEQRLENWRRHLEDAGLKVSRSKTEYLPLVNNIERIQMKVYESDDKTELPIATSFKYLGTNKDQEGGCSKEVAKRIECAWNRWRELTGILCDRKIPTKLKVLLYKTAFRPALTYGNETWIFTQKLEDKIGSTEMKMLRYIHNIHWEEHVTNDEIRQMAMIEPIADLMGT